MNPEEWRRVQELYHQVHQLPEQEWETFLSQQTDQSQETLDEVRRLLSATPPSVFVKPISGTEAQDDEARNLKHLGDFELLEEIGRGGMGVVFRAHQKSLDRMVAIKVLPNSWALSQRQIDRFEREARAVAKLSHPGVVSIYSVGEEGSTHFIAMELVEGHDLGVELGRLGSGSQEDTSVPPIGAPEHYKVVASMIKGVAEALEHAHQRGIVHRDVKPSNLLLTQQNALKVVDFGLARDESQGAITLTGELAGTPQYMSPEQVRLRNHLVDHRTDIYSLGVVMYEVITGKRPFDGSDSTKLMRDILVREARHPRLRVPSIPRDLETICLKALEKAPDDRYPTAGELARDLGRFLNHEAIHARPVSPPRRILRKLLRQPKLSVLALVLIAVAGLSYAFGTLNPPPPQGTVHYRGGPGFETGQLWVQEIDPLSSELSAARLLSSKPSDSFQLGLGLYRFTALESQDPKAGFSEMTRQVLADQEVELRPFLGPAQPVHSGMLAIPAGDYIVGAEEEFFIRELERRTITLPGYWIDRSEVTNGEYLSYLEAQPTAQRPRHWPADGNPFPNEWAGLPVIGVSYQDARGFSEWAGKRLPARDEWEVAATGGQGLPYPWGEEAGNLKARAVYSRWSPANDGTDSSDEWWGYAQLVHPAAEPFGEDISPFGLLHTMGNVSEWTETAALQLMGAHVVLEHTHLVMGFSWHMALDSSASLWGMFQYPDVSHETGFRCAKSMKAF